MELRIKELLKERGLTIKEVAEKIGMDASNLNSSIKKNPKLSTLIDIANAVGCDISELFRAREEAPKRHESQEPIIMLGGEVYRLAPARDIVKLPVYTDYSVFRSNLKGFLQRAAKQRKEGEPFSLTGMLGTFEVFTLLYAPEQEYFYLTLCYKNGKTLSYSYDATYEFADAKKNDGSWDMECLYEEIKNDIEDIVKGKIETGEE